MDKKLSLKLLIDTKSNRVIFAEARKEVVDFLFSLLALPIGTIIKLLSKEQMKGSIGDLYASLQQLDESYLLSSSKRISLLNPPVVSAPVSKTNTLFLPPPPVTVKKFYRCSYDGSHNVTEKYGTTCPSCNRPASMTQEMQYVAGKTGEEGLELGVVKGVVTYSITDDMFVEPMSTISSITILNKFQIEDLSSLQERNVELGMEEGLKLLKASLESKNVLTAVFLNP